MIKKAIAMLAIASLLGCATIIAPGPDTVPVMTNPAGAQVFLNGQFVGYTPTVVALERSHPAQIQIQLQGFQPVVLTREKNFNGWFLGSILLFYTIIPMIIDIAAGNVTRYDDTGIAIGLTPLYGAPPPPQPQPYQQPVAPPMQGGMQPPPMQPQPPPR